jgi:hypothetical protein
MVGIFSIEKTIRLGDSPLDGTKDPLISPFYDEGQPFEPKSTPSLKPQIQSLDLLPKEVNTTDAPQSVNLTAWVLSSGDSSSGGEARMVSPSGREVVEAKLLPVMVLGNQSLLRGTLTLPAGSEPGAWRLDSLSLLDDGAGRSFFIDQNNLSTSPELEVHSLDRSPPTILSFDFQPKMIDPSFRPQSVSFRLEAEDYSGPSSGKVLFVSPSGAQTAEALLAPSGRGLLTGSLMLSDSMERGAWLLHNLTLADDSGNARTWSRWDMISQGFPTQFMVYR